MAVAPIGPDHGRPGAVRPIDDGGIGHVDPLAFEAHAVVAVSGFPIDVIETKRVGAIAARRFGLAREPHEPAVELGMGAIVRMHAAPGEHAGDDEKDDEKEAADGAWAVVAGRGHGLRSPMITAMFFLKSSHSLKMRFSNCAKSARSSWRRAL